jgi:hypothetical protein
MSTEEKLEHLFNTKAEKVALQSVSNGVSEAFNRIEEIEQRLGKNSKS